MTVGPDLYWSLRGEVACGEHAPPPDSPRWQDERWQRVPTFVFTDLRKRLQCQHCEEASGRPYRHDRREATATTDAEVAHDDAAAREYAVLVAQMDNLRRDYDALMRGVSITADLSAVLRRVREHLDALSSLMETVRNRSPGVGDRRH